MNSKEIGALFILIGLLFGFTIIAIFGFNEFPKTIPEAFLEGLSFGAVICGLVLMMIGKNEE